MYLRTTKKLALRKSHAVSSAALVYIPKAELVEIVGKSIKYDGKHPFIKAKYQSFTGWVNCRYLYGMLLSTANNTKNYPKRVTISNGTPSGQMIRIPQQTNFGSFCKSHGCSIAAVTTVLQMYGIHKDPDDVVTWCKKNLSGWTGSKLTIYGCMQAINGIVGRNVATWHPITGNNNNDTTIVSIREEMRNGNMVIFEQKTPIHTVTFIGRKPNGKIAIATNGKITTDTINHQVKKKALCDSSCTKKNFWPKAAGYVICKRV